MFPSKEQTVKFFGKENVPRKLKKRLKKYFRLNKSSLIMLDDSQTIHMDMSLVGSPVVRKKQVTENEQ